MASIFVGVGVGIWLAVKANGETRASIKPLATEGLTFFFTAVPIVALLYNNVMIALMKVVVETSSEDTVMMDPAGTSGAVIAFSITLTLLNMSIEAYDKVMLAMGKGQPGGS